MDDEDNEIPTANDEDNSIEADDQQEKKGPAEQEKQPSDGQLIIPLASSLTTNSSSSSSAAVSKQLSTSKPPPPSSPKATPVLSPAATPSTATPSTAKPVTPTPSTSAKGGVEDIHANRQSQKKKEKKDNHRDHHHSSSENKKTPKSSKSPKSSSVDKPKSPKATGPLRKRSDFISPDGKTGELGGQSIECLDAVERNNNSSRDTSSSSLGTATDNNLRNRKSEECLLDKSPRQKSQHFLDAAKIHKKDKHGGKHDKHSNKDDMDRKKSAADLTLDSSEKPIRKKSSITDKMKELRQKAAESQKLGEAVALTRIKSSDRPNSHLVIDKKKLVVNRQMDFLNQVKPNLGGLDAPLPPQIAALTVPNRIRCWANQEVRKGLKGIIEEHRQILERKSAADKTHIAFSQNPSKNKDPKIKCFDDTRVILKEGGANKYIHANYVDGTYPKEYIATQGVLMETRNDFWEMIWQENILVAVMLCSYIEDGAIQSFPCHNNEPNRTTSFGKYQVTTNSIEVRSVEKHRYTRAELNVSNGLETRRVVFMTHQSWGPKRPPSDGFPITLFLDKVHNEHRRVAERMKIDPENEPILIQCNSGVGRTGTLLAIDIAWKALVVRGVICIKVIVEKLRDQRAHCLTETRDYMFIYLTVFDNLVRGKYVQGPEMEFFRNSLVSSIPKL